MKFSSEFIGAGHAYATYSDHVPAPYFRKTFALDGEFSDFEITITGLGFYRLWINGAEITKGLLAPYISNPDHIVYYDNYKINELLDAGTNVIAVQLGNGMQNANGGEVWDFDTDTYRGAVRFAFALEGKNGGRGFVLEADETVKTCPSPLYFDDLRAGARYDASKEIPNWNIPEFNDSGWDNAVRLEKPRGEAKLCGCEPVLPRYTLKPVSVRAGIEAPYENAHPNCRSFGKCADVSERSTGYIYDFGVNTAGICQLHVNGRPGQRIEMQFAEMLDGEGRLYYGNHRFYPRGYCQRDVYICKGGEAFYTPKFTYHGFRYCLVTGLDENQATPDALTFIVCSSAVRKRGSFSCSCETANRLFAMSQNSDASNFYYFPTDCPHREKNGWTGDASQSAEHMLMTGRYEKSFREWMNSVRRSMKDSGDLPGMVPTGKWGYGTGPGWDAVITEVPFMVYKYTGDTEILKENAAAIFRYLSFITTKLTEDGTIDYGLADWVPVAGKMKCTREFANSVMAMHIADTAVKIFGALGQELRRNFAQSVYDGLYGAIRGKFLNRDGSVDTGCQTSTAMAVYYGLLDFAEGQRAVDALVGRIHENGDFIDIGMYGARTLFHTLAKYGYAELAFRMIVRPEWPSYGNFIELGYTALPEDFVADSEKPDSLDHHFLGDISSFFIKRIAGLDYNPDGTDTSALRFNPCYCEGLDGARATFDSPFGKITAGWHRGENGKPVDDIEIPCGIHLI